MALIDLRQIKNGVELQTKANEAHSKATNLETTVIPQKVSELQGKIEVKADKSYVDTELGKKAVKEEVTAELNKKANTDWVSGQLDGKANASHTHAHTEITGLGDVVTKNVGTAAGNVPVLGGDGKLDAAVIPAVAINEFFEATSVEDAMSKTVQNGDIVHISAPASEDGGPEAYAAEGVTGTFICVNDKVVVTEGPEGPTTADEAFKLKFRPLTSLGDGVSRGEFEEKLGQKADKSQVTTDINAAKEAVKNELNQTITQKEQALNTKIEEAKNAAAEALRPVSEKANANAEAINGLKQKDTQLEEKISGIEGKLESFVATETTKTFTATNNQTEFVLEVAPKNAETIKVFVNGVKAPKNEYSYANADGHKVTWKHETAGYQIGEGFIVEVVYN